MIKILLVISFISLFTIILLSGYIEEDLVYEDKNFVCYWHQKVGFIINAEDYHYCIDKTTNQISCKYTTDKYIPRACFNDYNGTY